MGWLKEIGTTQGGPKILELNVEERREGRVFLTLEVRKRKIGEEFLQTIQISSNNNHMLIVAFFLVLELSPSSPTYIFC